MRHIFCGHIVGSGAQGLHSLSTVTNWQACAKVDTAACKYFNDGNGWCPMMWIYNSQLSSFAAKSDTTLWPATLPPAVIVLALQNLYNNCIIPPITNAKITLCFPECRYAPESQYKNHRFDIVIISERKSIISAYPATRGTCLKHQYWRQCASKYCQFLN